MMNPSLDEHDSSVDALLAMLCARASVDGIWASRTFPKGHILFDQNNVPADVFILTRGLVKLVYFTPDGDERIKSFIVDQGVFALEEGGLAFGACTLEPSTVIRLSLNWVKKQLSGDAELQRSYSQFTDWVRRRKARREQSLLCASATERFHAMQLSEPDLMSRLPQGDVARYLGITPIAFSRIKRRIRVIS